jgi:hypothetical protein
VLGMTRIVVEHLEFHFGEQWQVFKLDDHHDYRQGIAKIDDTKAVDLLGIFDHSALFFIEVKDFRGYRIENKERLSTGELAKEIAQKVKDSVACIIGAFRSSSEPEYWQPYVKMLCTAKSEVKVVVWIEENLPTHVHLRKKAMAGTNANVFKQKLSWLTKRVLVCGSQRSDFPDVKVINLPRS